MSVLSLRRTGSAVGFVRCLSAWLLASLLLAASSLALAVGDTSADEVGRGLLWRISSPSGDVGYLFGTMHSSDRSVTDLAPEVEAAFTGSKRVVLELDMTEAGMKTIGAMMLYRDGSRLRDHIPASLYRQLEALATERSEVDALVLDRMKPWAAGLMIAAPASRSGEVLDQILARRARDAGKVVIGLETVSEQLGVFSGLSAADQLQLLSEIVAEYDELEGFHKALDAAYHARDIDHILALSQQDLHKEDARLARILLTGLIDDRNHRMAQRVDRFLNLGGTFIAVGALHLPGKEGLIRLLRQRGYAVDAVW